MVACPKCKASGDDILLIELWRDHSIEFNQNADGTIEAEGILHDGSPYRVQARCFECGKAWTLRGVLQITDLPRDRKPKGESIC